MKNLQNIIGGEKNFVFSDKSIFLGLNNFLEKRRIFNSTPEALEQTNEIVEKIEKNKNEIKNTILPNIYAEWSKTQTEPKLDGFKKFLESFAPGLKNEDGENPKIKENYKLENKTGTEDFSPELKKLLKNLSGKVGNNTTSENSFKLFEPKERFIKKEDGKGFDKKYEDGGKPKLTFSDKELQEIVNGGEKLREHERSKEQLKESMGDQSIDFLKNLDFGKIFQSETGIITAGIALVSAFKLFGNKAGYGILGVIGASILGNEASGGKFTEMINKWTIGGLEHVNLSNIEKHWKTEYALTTEQIKIFGDFANMKTDDFNKVAKKSDDLLKLAKGEKTEIYGLEIPEGVNPKDYAEVAIKILAKKGGYQFKENEGINGISEESINNGKNIYEKSDLEKVSHHFSTETETLFGGKYEWIKENVKDIGKEGYVALIENPGLVDLFQDFKEDFGEIGENIKIFEYKGGNWHILDSVHGQGNKNIMVESWDATGRIINLSYEGTKSTFKWTFGGENPIEDFKKWLKSPTEETTEN